MGGVRVVMRVLLVVWCCVVSVLSWFVVVCILDSFGLVLFGMKRLGCRVGFGVLNV